MRGRGMKQSVTAWIVISLVPLVATAEPSRTIPRGELNAHVIEKLFSSPVGEVEFTTYGMGRSGFLRNARGVLMGFSEVRGPWACEEYFQSEKTGLLPEGCEFVFYNAEDGRFLSVRSHEMQEATLFDAARGKLRAWRTYVSL